MASHKALTNNPQQFRQYNCKCVCQICTCGKHHCPPSGTKFFGQTTNHHDYKAYNIATQKKSPIQYEIHQSHYDPKLLKTQYQKDYVAYQIQPHLNPLKYQYPPKKLMPFYDETQYNKSYVPFQVAVERPATTPHLDYRNKAKFDGTTTYNVQFSPKHIQRVPRSPVTYQRKKIPFEGQSMYNSQFKAHKIQITKPTVCHCGVYQGRKNKFMGESRYHEDFKPFQVEKQCTCPINLMPQVPIKCSPGKNHIRYISEQKKWE